MSTFIQNVVSVAMNYVNQQEKTNNSGFKDPNFEKKMKWVGWLKGHPWCAYFVELVYKDANIKTGESKKIQALFDSLFSGSVAQTFNNFKNFVGKNKEFFKISMEPKKGSIVIWRSKVNPVFGHTAVVIDVKSNGEFVTVEGNTNDKGGREGYIVAVRKRDMSGNGYKLVGFIEPIF